MEDIFNRIPHRPPFLFVERIVEQTGDRIRAQARVRPEAPYFQGHFPGYPIMPGVLICEFAFQTGAALIAGRAGGLGDRIPVLTRVQNVRFKNPVFPGDLMESEVSLKEKAGPAHYLEGVVRVGEKKILTLEFAVMSAEKQRPEAMR